MRDGNRMIKFGLGLPVIQSFETESCVRRRISANHARSSRFSPPLSLSLSLSLCFLFLLSDVSRKRMIRANFRACRATRFRTRQSPLIIDPRAHARRQSRSSLNERHCRASLVRSTWTRPHSRPSVSVSRSPARGTREIAIGIRPRFRATRRSIPRAPSCREILLRPLPPPPPPAPSMEEPLNLASRADERTRASREFRNRISRVYDSSTLFPKNRPRIRASV